MLVSGQQWIGWKCMEHGLKALPFSWSIRHTHTHTKKQYNKLIEMMEQWIKCIKVRMPKSDWLEERL